MGSLRWWLRLGAAGLITAGLLLGGVVLAVFAEREDGSGGALAERLEQFIRQNESLHYQMHMTVGKVLSFCPCTRGRSAEEYRKASFHAPEEVRQARALKAKLPGSEPQVDALVVCQGAVKARLRGTGEVVVFPQIRLMSAADLTRAVFDNGSGTLNVVQTIKVGKPEVVYTCDAQRNAFGRWVVRQVTLL